MQFKRAHFRKTSNLKNKRMKLINQKLIPRASVSDPCSGCLWLKNASHQLSSSQRWNQVHIHCQDIYDELSKFHLQLVDA